MNLTRIDWLIVAAFIAFVILSVAQSRRYMRSVADFLSAGRTGGRYLLSVSQGMCAIGSITIIGYWQQNYASGFVSRWWDVASGIVLIILAVSGWVTYRFRQTRCLTMAQFFEIRYSRRFRIFAGLVAFLSGIVNFGIFPSVGALFFLHFCGIPEHFQWLGVAWSAYPLIMLAFLAVSLFFVFTGGQIAVMITDFLQAIFVSVVFVILVVYLLCLTGVVNWHHVAEVLAHAEKGKSLINPFKTGEVEVFNIWYFAINIVILIYNKLSWQGTQGFNASAKSAHEAKMGEVLSTWRWIPQNIMFVVVPVIACVVMKYGLGDSAAITGIQDSVNAGVARISAAETKAIGDQMITPLVLVKLLPPGLMGALTAAMLASTIGTHASYLHSWGAIFIQDVVMPFRKKPFAPKQHILLLRGAILGVAVFIFLFSMLFKNSEKIWPFLMITGAIFCGGSGAVIIGGLYWRRGTTRGAWTALLAGSGVAVGAILLTNYWAKLPDLLSPFVRDPEVVRRFFAMHEPLNGAWMSLISMTAAVVSYAVVSLLDNKRFDMDRLLHRGAYAVPGEAVVEETHGARAAFWKIFGMGREFTRRDKAICLLAYGWTFGWMALFLGVTGWNFLIREIPDPFWIGYWRVYIWVNVAAAVIVTVWFAIGGFRDLFRMIKQLKTMTRDHSDDGFVERKEAKE